MSSVEPTINGQPVFAGKLGCKPPKPQAQSRLLKLAKYLSVTQLPPIPPVVDWKSKVVAWPMMLNDSIGDCTIATAGHLQQSWSTDAGTPVTPSDAQILAAYEAVTGLEGGAYSPATGQNDNGCVLTDVLDYWRKSGIAGNQCGAYAGVEPTDHAMIQAAIFLFGGVACGVNLPRAWQGANQWTAPSRNHRFGEWAVGSWGGHAIPAVSFDAQFVYVVSWGSIVPVTWAAFDMYFAEAYAVIDQLWFSGTESVSGFDLPTLTNDLAAVTGQQQAA